MSSRPPSPSAASLTSGAESPPSGWIAALCGGVGALAYAGAIHGGPLVFDDVTAISDDGGVAGPWWTALRLSWLGAGSPLFLRATSVLLHACVCAVAWRVLARVLPKRVALAATVLFAVIAAPSEAVETVAGRADLLLLLLGLLGFQAHVAGRRLAAAWFLLLALGCKQSAIFFPLLWIALGPREGRTVRGAALYLAPVAIAVASRFLVFGGVHLPRVPLLVNPLQAAPLPGRLLGAGRIFARFTAPGLLDPGRRLYLCSAPACGPAEPSEVLAWLGLALLAALPAAVLALRRRAPHAAAGLFVFALLWLPVASLVLPSSPVYSERLLYLPALGLCIAAASLLETRAWPVAGPLLATLAVWNAVALQYRHRDWRDRVQLYLSALPLAPDAARVQHNAAVAFLLQHDAAAAAAHASLALELWPDFPEARATQARSLEKLDRAR